MYLFSWPVTDRWNTAMELPLSALPAGGCCCCEELCWTSGCLSWSVPWLFCKTGWGHTPSAWQKGGCVPAAHNSPGKLMLTKVHGVYYLHIEGCGGSRRLCHLWIGKHCVLILTQNEVLAQPGRRGGRRLLSSDRVSQEGTTVADWPVIQPPLPILPHAWCFLALTTCPGVRPWHWEWEHDLISGLEEIVLHI